MNTFYDYLEISSDASPQEIRTAYLRVKAAYKKDSPALYTLFDPSQSEEILSKIEEAYLMLSNSEKRKEYDKNHGLVSPDFPTLESDPNLLVAPPTDFSREPTGVPPEFVQKQALLQRFEIESETEWKGFTLKKIRESKKISLEEMSETTKIGKKYITAIEEESFALLPAPVFLRGFLTQIAKILKLPHEKVVSAYLTRYTGSYEGRARNK